MATTDGRHILPFEVPILELEQKIEELESFSLSTEMDLSTQIRELKARCEELKRDIFGRLTPWQRVQLARHPDRPLLSDYMKLLFDDHLELHGDRAFRDDKAVLTAFARLGEYRVMVVGHRKGRTTRERIDCNFGSAHPEGYRKARLKMQLAADRGLPIITLIDTPGAYPGIGAEQRGQATVIAENLMHMAGLPVPIVSLVIGEGGSGGALGIGVADRLLMLENAYYSVISPEGCSAILWKTADKTEVAAGILKLTAEDLRGFGIVDEVIPEPLGGAHRDPVQTTDAVREALLRHLAELLPLSPERLMDQRYEKYRRIGVWTEAAREAIEPAARDRVPAPEGP